MVLMPLKFNLVNNEKLIYNKLLNALREEHINRAKSACSSSPPISSPLSLYPPSTQKPARSWRTVHQDAFTMRGPYIESLKAISRMLRELPLLPMGPKYVLARRVRPILWLAINDRSPSTARLASSKPWHPVAADGLKRAFWR